MIYVKWDRPRLWSVRLSMKTGTSGYRLNKSVGVVAESVDRAIEAAQAAHPEARINSVNDCGAVDIVADGPLRTAMQDSLSVL